jgi:hypothetical protein
MGQTLVLQRYERAAFRAQVGITVGEPTNVKMGIRITTTVCGGPAADPWCDAAPLFQQRAKQDIIAHKAAAGSIARLGRTAQAGTHPTLAVAWPVRWDATARRAHPTRACLGSRARA